LNKGQTVFGIFGFHPKVKMENKLVNDKEDKQVSEEVSHEYMMENDMEESRRKRRRYLSLLLQSSLSPSFMAIVSPNNEDCLPKEIRVDINKALGLKPKTIQNKLIFPDVMPTSSSLSSRVEIKSIYNPLPEEEGYFEGKLGISLPDDKLYLNDLHTFARCQLEYFSATAEDVQLIQAGRRTPTVRGKVGIRCIHCAEATLQNSAATQMWPPGSVSYPSNLEGIYTACTQKIQLHMESCPFIPDSIKHELHRLSFDESRSSVRRQNSNNATNLSIGTAAYYLIAAKRVGLLNVPGGIRFGRDLTLQPLSVETVRAQVETQYLADRGGSQNSKYSNTDAASLQRIAADKESELVLAAAIADEDKDHIVGRSDDSKLVTDFVFLCIRQMAYCNVMPSDFESRGKKTALMRLGFTGFCCRYCHDAQNYDALQHAVEYSCRSFSSGPDNLSSAITNSFCIHLQKCLRVPIEIRKAISAYKKIHNRQISRLAHGSQRRLFHAIWSRLRSRDISEEDMKERLNQEIKRKPKQAAVSLQEEEDAIKSENDIAIKPDLETSERPISSESISVIDVELVDSDARGKCFPECDDPETKALLQLAEDFSKINSKHGIVLPSDRALVTDYVFFMMRMMRVAIPSSNDFQRGRRSTALSSRLAGFCCKFCHDHDSMVSATGRTFPSAPDNMASSLNTSLYNHMLRCIHVPEDVKRAVTNLKKIHSQQCSNLKFGSQRKFFNLVFSRLESIPIRLGEAKSLVSSHAHGCGKIPTKDDFFIKYNFWKISSSNTVECTKCRLLPLSWRAPNSVLTTANQVDEFQNHQNVCTGKEIYFGWISKSLNTVMKENPLITVESLKLQTFQNILVELIGKNSCLDRFHNKLISTNDEQALGNRIDVVKESTWSALSCLKSNVEYELVSKAYEKWALELGLEVQLQKNQSICKFFELIAPSLLIPK
jgi:hypothetical protein